MEDARKRLKTCYHGLSPPGLRSGRSQTIVISSRYRAALVGRSAPVGYGSVAPPLLLPPLFWTTKTASSGPGPSVFSQPPDSGKRHSDRGGADLRDRRKRSVIVGDRRQQDPTAEARKRPPTPARILRRGP